MFNVSNIRAWAGLVMFNIELHKTCCVRAVCQCCGWCFRLSSVFSVVLGMTLNYLSVTILLALLSLRRKAAPVWSCVNLLAPPPLRRLVPILTHAVKSCTPIALKPTLPPSFALKIAHAPLDNDALRSFARQGG
jgi:hypothetical protein